MKPLKLIPPPAPKVAQFRYFQREHLRESRDPLNIAYSQFQSPALCRAS